MKKYFVFILALILFISVEKVEATIKKEGVVKEYYKSGQLKNETNYKDGKREGLYKRYNESGQLEYEANYKADQRDGLEKDYYEKSILDIFFKPNQLRSETNYKDGKREGLHTRYHYNGNFLHKTYYKNDKREGAHKEYYSNGQVKVESYYINDKLLTEEIYKSTKEETMYIIGVFLVYLIFPISSLIKEFCKFQHGIYFLCNILLYYILYINFFKKIKNNVKFIYKFFFIIIIILNICMIFIELSISIFGTK